MTPTQEKKLKELRKYFKPQEKAFIMSAIPYMTSQEIATILKKHKTKVDTYISIFTVVHIKQRIKQMFSEARLQRWMEGDLPGFKTCRKMKRGSKKNVIGIRKDLGLFFRSKMEANLARILNIKYGRDAWEYEPEVFPLSPSRGKAKNYLPDFHITLKDGTDFWIEVKGRFFPGDISKMNKFIKEYPNHTLLMMTCKYSKKVKEFTAKKGIETWIYEELRDDYSSKIPEWE